VRRVAKCLAAAAACLGLATLDTAALAGSLQVQVRWADGRPAAGMAVTATSDDPARAPAAPVNSTLDQLDRLFTPELVLVPVGSTISFPNSDAVSHQVYSFSKAKHFQLPLYRGRPYPPVKFDEPGLVVLGCNIHDSMVGYIIVARAQHLGLTDAQGLFTATGVTDGNYEIRVMHPRMRAPSDERVGHVRINGAARGEFAATLERDLRPPPVKGRSREWDY
jgi:plastocyanin